jgi:hypothetical protein
VLTEQAHYKLKYEEVHQRLKQTEHQRDNLKVDCDNLRSELAGCIQ